VETGGNGKKPHAKDAEGTTKMIEMAGVKEIPKAGKKSISLAKGKRQRTATVHNLAEFRSGLVFSQRQFFYRRSSL
jgi:hypothetical protein